MQGLQDAGDQQIMRSCRPAALSRSNRLIYPDVSHGPHGDPQVLSFAPSTGSRAADVCSGGGVPLEAGRRSIMGVRSRGVAAGVLLLALCLLPAGMGMA